jgi:hypothetical protein
MAGALNGMACDYIQNLHRMIIWANKVRKLGCSTFVPGMDFLAGLVNGDWIYADYFNSNQAWLEVTDAVFVVPGWENSKGTQKEIDFALKHNIPIFYTLEEIENWLVS